MSAACGICGIPEDRHGNTLGPFISEETAAASKARSPITVQEVAAEIRRHAEAGGQPLDQVVRMSIDGAHTMMASIQGNPHFPEELKGLTIAYLQALALAGRMIQEGMA